MELDWWKFWKEMEWIHSTGDFNHLFITHVTKTHKICWKPKFAKWL